MNITVKGQTIYKGPQTITDIYYSSRQKPRCLVGSADEPTAVRLRSSSPRQEVSWMRVSSTRMTVASCNQYFAVVAGLDPATHEKRDVASGQICLDVQLSRAARLIGRPKTSGATLTGQQWDEPRSDASLVISAIYVMPRFIRGIHAFPGSDPCRTA